MLRIKKERNTKAIPCSWWPFPILSGPLLEVNCLCAPCLSLTHPTALASCQKDIHTDDINIPAIPFGHTKGENKSKFVLFGNGTRYRQTSLSVFDVYLVSFTHTSSMEHSFRIKITTESKGQHLILALLTLFFLETQIV